MESRTLDRPPDLAPLYARAIATNILPRGSELPDVELVVRDVEIDRSHLTAYEQVCGFRVGDDLPLTYPHVIAFPVAMALMTERAFPFPLLGLVHIANRITQQRPLLASDRPTVRVRAQNLRPHPRGRQLELVAEAEVEGERVWVDESTYLRRGDGSGESQREEPPVSAQDAAATWELPGDIGRRYAAVSGDRNPIHMHPLPAKLFGFPGAIAHGMWMKARCLAALEGRLPGAARAEVEFRAPLKIPGSARFGARRDEHGFSFALYSADGERLHLMGSAGAVGG
jgi:hypothetical protein